MIKGEYWAAFQNDQTLAPTVHKIPDAFGGGILHLPVLYKLKRQAKKEGWTNIKKVKVVLVN